MPFASVTQQYLALSQIVGSKGGNCDVFNGTKIGGGTATDDTACIQAVLDNATATNPLKIIADCASLMTGLNIPNTGAVEIEGLGDYTGLFVKSGANSNAVQTYTHPWVPSGAESNTGSSVKLKNMTINANRPGNSTSGDLRGAGASGPWYGCINLHGIDRVVIEDVYQYNMPAFSTVLNACRDVTVRDGRVESPSRSANTDGIHVNGGCQRVRVTGTKFGTGDDAVAINVNEGDVTGGADIIVSDIQLDDCNTGVRIYGRNARTRRVQVKGVTGKVRFWPAIVGVEATYANTAECNNSILFKDFDVEFTSGYTNGGGLLLEGSCGHLKLDNFWMHSPISAVPMIKTDGTNSSGIVVSLLDILNSGIYRNGDGSAAAYLLDHNAGTIADMRVRNFDVGALSGSAYGAISTLIKNNSGTLSKLMIQGCKLDNVTNKTSGTIGSIDDRDAAFSSASANQIFAGPASGGAAAPAFRAIVPADLPLASSSAYGAVKADGSTITAASGVISAASPSRPTFHAYVASNQAIAASSETTVQFGTESFDTAACYDTSTYKFTPNVAGKYKVLTTIAWAAINSAYSYYLTIRKNGISVAHELMSDTFINGRTYSQDASCEVDMNGTTDYLTVTVFQDSGSSLNVLGTSAPEDTWFEANLVS